MGVLRIVFEEAIAYVWVCVYDHYTCQARTYFELPIQIKNQPTIPIILPSVDCTLKFTAYQLNATQLQNKGTVIVRIRRNTNQEKAAVRTLTVQLHALRPPLRADGTLNTTVPWRRSIQTRGLRATIQSLQLECLYNVTETYQILAMRCIETTLSKAQTLLEAPSIHGCCDFKGFIRNSQFDFDMPFAMPGAWGIRFMAPGVFPVHMWIQLVYMACCLCGYKHDKYKQASAKQQLQIQDALAVVALGCTWMSGYEYERIDDTSPTWSSLGSTKDCEDFVITFVSLANTILQSTGLFAAEALSAFFSTTIHLSYRYMEDIVCLLTTHIQNTFKDPSMVCGWMQPVYNDTKKEAHAWGAIYNNRTRQHMFVECTGPIVPHMVANPTLEEAQHQQCVLYNNALTAPSSTFSQPGDTYGPATFQPSYRYVAIATQYTADCGYALGPLNTQNTIGLSADAFKEMQYVKTKLSPGKTKAIQTLRRLDYQPCFTDKQLLARFRQVLEQRQYPTATALQQHTSSHIAGHNNTFVPSLFLPAQKIPTRWQLDTTVQLDVVHPLPYMLGVLLFKKSKE